MSRLLAMRYERGKLELLDQRLLPLESTYIPVRTPQQAFDAIRSMVVRGAPAIGCTAALAVAAWLVERGAGSQYDTAASVAEDVQATTDHLVQRCDALRPAARLFARSALMMRQRHCALCQSISLVGALRVALAALRSRPTAVNLADACNKLAAIASASSEAPGATPQSVVEAVVMTAEAYYQHDIATCKVGHVHATGVHVLPSAHHPVGHHVSACSEASNACPSVLAIMAREFMIAQSSHS